MVGFFLFHWRENEDLNVCLYRLHLNGFFTKTFLPPSVCVCERETLESGEYNIGCTHFYVAVCFSVQVWFQPELRCVFGTLLGSLCISRAADDRVCVWLQVRVESQRLSFQFGSTVVLHQPSEVKV